MFFRSIFDEDLAQTAYLIGCQKTGEALIIDPERDVDRYFNLAKANDLLITAVAETHIHADFLSGAREIAESAKVTLYLSDEGDQDWKYRWLDSKLGGGSYSYKLLKDGATFSIGGIEVKALHTPGHTPEHLSFLITDRGGGADEAMGIVSGDFIFVGDLGRPDLLETAAGVENVKEQYASLLAHSARIVLDLPDYLQVWPAHGAGSACGKALGAVPQSTMGYEKRFNPALKLAAKPEEFATYILSDQPAPPLYFARMKSDNRDGPAVLGQLPRPIKHRAVVLATTDTHDIAVLDFRSWEEFVDGHLEGVLWMPQDKTFATIAGSYINPTEEIYLIIEAERIDWALRNLVRVGLDKITASVDPDDYRALLRDKLLKTKTLTQASADSAWDIDASEQLLLDVRNEGEFARGALPTARQIAHTRLLSAIDALPIDKQIAVYCQSGRRSRVASALLQRHGFEVVNLSGGYSEWKKEGNNG